MTENKTKILVASSLHSIDDPRVFQKEAVSLAKRYDVHLVAVGSPAEHLPNKKVKGVQLHPFQRRGGKLLGTLRAYRSICRCYRQVRPDALHFHDPELVPMGFWLSIFSRCKVVYDVHEDVLKTLAKKTWLPRLLKRPLAWLFGRLEMMAVRRFQLVVVAEPYAMRRFLGPNTVLVRNYFPLLPDRPRQVFDGSRPLRLIYVGSLTRMRGVANVVEALGFMKVAAELWLVGKFHSRSFREEILAGRRNVKYLGWASLDKVYDYLLDADIGMNCILPAPSHEEMLGTKVFDYMAARLPVIASNFSVWPEIIEGAGCGVCVDPKDPRAIAAAVDELACTPERMLAMGDVGRRLFEEKYNWPLEEVKLLEAYSNLTLGENVNRQAEGYERA